MVFKSSSGSGGGGGGTVTSVGTGTGLTGGPITTTGTISVANSTMNSLAGYNNSGVFSTVTVGANLTLSGGTLSSTSNVTALGDLTDCVTDYTNFSMYLGLHAGDSATSGAGNTSVGEYSLSETTDGNNNTAFGYNALKNNTQGDENTAFGANALVAMDTVTNLGNIGIGSSAGAVFSQGDDNIFMGRNSGTEFVSGNGNILIGYNGGTDFTTGNNVILIGYDIYVPDDPIGNYLNIGDTITGDLFAGDITILNNLTAQNFFGTWAGNKIGLAYGGTNADLSATGGSSQVLKQSSAGAAITVGQLAASDLSNGTTGSGAVVLATSPTLTAPNLGSANAIQIALTNGGSIDSDTSGTLLFRAFDTDDGVYRNLITFTVGTDPYMTFRDGARMGTPTSVTLTNATGLPISTGVSGLGTGVATFLATPSSANLAAAVTDETGSGSLVFANSPVFTTPNIGSATGSVSGNAGTATALQNARTIGGVSFDGTANIVPQTIESANEATDTTCFPLFITASGTQQLQPKNNTALTFNSNSGALGATSVTATGVMASGANGGTGGQLTLSGSTSGSCAIKVAAAAGTSTIFQLPADNGTNTYVLQTDGNGVTSWVAASGGVPTQITVANEATDTTCFPLFVTAATGDLGPKSNASLTFNSNTGALGATTLGGTLSTAAQPNVTSVGTLTGGATGAGFTVALGTSTVTGTIPTANLPTAAKVKTIGFSTATASPATGQQGSYAICEFSGTITAWNIGVDAGTCTVKVWKIAAGTTSPTVANNINTSGVAISSGTFIRSTTVTDFTTTTVTAGDIFAFNLSDVSGASKIFFGLEITSN